MKIKDYFDWDVLNREFSTEERERLAEKGHAMSDGSYPIVTREDLENAIQAIGRSKNPDATKTHIKKRAKALGLEELIPEEWGGPANWTPRRPQARASKDWYRIENKTTGPSDIYIYDEIGGFGVSVGDFLAEVRSVSGPLNLHLNSPGGDVFDGVAVYSALKRREEPTTVIVDGLAASIASVIALGADKVVMAPKSKMMIHDGWTAAAGNAGDFRKLVDLLDETSNTIASVYNDKAGGGVEFWRERMRAETWYNAEEALAAGLIDEVEGQARKRDDFDLSMFNYAGRDNAPEPVLRPQQLKGEHGPEMLDLPAGDPVTPESKKDEPAPFAWDFEAFKNALKGV
jgi:ATP-dependent protease ClpP protease subunit